MDNYYLTANDHERYLDSLARSKAMCADDLRHGVCTFEKCKSCDKKQLLDACEAELAPYSKLLLDDKTKIAIDHVIDAHPTLEEVKEKIENERQAYKDAVIQAQKDLNWEWWHSGGWMYVVAILFTLIVVPIILSGEWFL